MQIKVTLAYTSCALGGKYQDLFFQSGFLDPADFFKGWILRLYCGFCCFSVVPVTGVPGSKVPDTGVPGEPGAPVGPGGPGGPVLTIRLDAGHA